MDFTEKATSYLEQLCFQHPHRQVGSIGNHAAVQFFKDTLAMFSMDVETQDFTCMDWEDGGATLSVNGKTFPVQVSPYSLGCEVEAPLAFATSIAELSQLDLQNKILVLHGEIAQEQIMPKNFVFYNPEHHQALVKLLEEKNPLAIIAITGRDPGLAGGVYPFSLFEDGDFNIPSIYMKDVDGEALLGCDGEIAVINSKAVRHPSTGSNVIGRKGGGSGKRVVICAHIDAKVDAPGALDNGTGVVANLLLGEMLQDYDGALAVEILAVNGEDYYSAAGEMKYLEENTGKFGDMVLAINMDCVGYLEGPTAFSLYNLPDAMAESFKRSAADFPGLVEGEQWYQSDHSVFIQQGVPAIAFTSEVFPMLTTEITHTPKDHPRLVDIGKIVETAQFLRAFVDELNEL